MSQYYTARRSKNLFDPVVNKVMGGFPFKLSRSKLEMFLQCPRCFYLDRRLGVGQPGGFPFNLNSAVDHLLKKEFDFHRARGEAHPLMKHYKIDAVPFKHPNIDEWRDTFTGVQALHKPTNFLFFGAVDELWSTSNGEIIVVDFKATSKDSEVNIDAEWQEGYKRQMEIYQWLLRYCFDSGAPLKVSNIGYFVYCNGRRDKEAFDGKLEFDIKLIPYKGDDSWVEGALKDARKCLDSYKIPASSNECDFCAYRNAALEVENSETKSRHGAVVRGKGKKTKQSKLF